jgi:hypothetical protein
MASVLKSSLNGSSRSTASSSVRVRVFKTDCLPYICLSWLQARWNSRAVFYFQLNPCGHSPYVTFSLTREWVSRLKLLLVFASTVILWSESLGTHDRILLSQIRDSPNLDDQVPVFISPRNRVAQLYPPTLGFLFVASYDSQSCDGSIRPRLHTGGFNFSPYKPFAQTK